MSEKTPISQEMQELGNLYHRVFKGEHGALVLDDMQRSFCKRSSFRPGDPYETHFREGQRDVVLKIETLIDVAENPSKYEVEVITDEEEIEPPEADSSDNFGD